LLTRFIDEGRAYFIYGNHDIEKKKYALRTLRERKSFKYLEDGDKRNVAAFFKTKVHEGLILRHRVTGDKIFLYTDIRRILQTTNCGGSANFL